MYKYIHTYIHTHVYIHVYLYIYICTHIYICTQNLYHMYRYTYIHTCIHTYTHTRIPRHLGLLWLSLRLNNAAPLSLVWPPYVHCV